MTNLNFSSQFTAETAETAEFFHQPQDTKVNSWLCVLATSWLRFRFPDEIDQRLEYYRNLYKEDQITVEKIREERARLQALGRDSSLEAAIAALRGGRG